MCQLLQIFETGTKISPHNELLVFFFIHSFAMLSTITNPILYGWLNTNLKHLFRAMIPTVRGQESIEMNALAGKRSFQTTRHADTNIQLKINNNGQNIIQNPEIGQNQVAAAEIL